RASQPCRGRQAARSAASVKPFKCHPERSEGSALFLFASRSRSLVAPLLGMTGEGMTKKPRRPSPAASIRPRAPRGIDLLLFVAALAMRLLFWRATPDFAWSHSAYFKGDAP